MYNNIMSIIIVLRVWCIPTNRFRYWGVVVCDDDDDGIFKCRFPGPYIKKKKGFLPDIV